MAIMIGIKKFLLSQPQCHDNTMYWAACCLVFFGFLRSSEFTVPAQDSHALSTSGFYTGPQVSYENHPGPYKAIQDDPFRQGVNLYLGRTDMDICPVRALLPYLAISGNFLYRGEWEKGTVLCLSSQHCIWRRKLQYTQFPYRGGNCSHDSRDSSSADQDNGTLAK